MSYLSSMELMEKGEEHTSRLADYFAMYRELSRHIGTRPLTIGSKWTKDRLLKAAKEEAKMEESNYQEQVQRGLASPRFWPPYCIVCMQFLEDGNKCKCGARCVNGPEPEEKRESESMNRLHGEQEVETAVTVVSECELEPTCKDVPVRQTGWVVIALNYVHSTPVTPNGLAMIFSSKEEAVAAIEGHLIKTGDKRPLYPVKLREGYANRDVTKTVEKVIHTTFTAPGIIKV